MKITVHSSDGHRFSIPFPTALLTSPAAIRIALKIANTCADTPAQNIPPEAVQALCQSIRQIKRKYGQWELVHVESADGNLVSIIL